MSIIIYLSIYLYSEYIYIYIYWCVLQQWALGVSSLATALDRLQHTRCSRADTLLLDTLGLALGGQINLASLGTKKRQILKSPYSDFTAQVY